MKENDALAAIAERCQSGDPELDTVQVDKIVDEFLRSAGYGRLADAIEAVDKWRA